uniref:Uncharacterized protein LOC114345752 n=1 Tax=Diabrotica virgifera virgifera TaxID=50390 RepID=A0A6P7H1J6_DIAVI
MERNKAINIIQNDLKVDQASIKNTEDISRGILNKNVDINIIRTMATYEAWKSIQDIIQEENQRQDYCNICLQECIDQESVVVCDGCLLTYHITCINNKKLKTKFWFCRGCHNNNNNYCYF